MEQDKIELVTTGDSWQEIAPNTAIINKNYNVQTQYDKPDRTKVQLATTDFQSFLELVKLYKTPNTFLLFNYDYVEARLNPSLNDMPDYDDSFIVFRFKPRPTWQNILNAALDWQSVKVTEMISWLQEIAPHVTYPNQATMLKAIENIQQIKKSSVISTDTGMTESVEVTVGTANTKYKLPTKLTLNYPLHYNWPSMVPDITLQLKYEVMDGNIRIKYYVNKSDLELLEPFKQNVKQELSSTKLPFFVATRL